jgi:sugar/nucleoside kinase (ribokinase family)
MKRKVIVAGHACLDITPIFPHNLTDFHNGDILFPGKLVQMKGVDIHAGGAVSNTGIAMKLLGTDVCLMAKTGNDAFGKILMDIYSQYGIGEGIIAEEGENTSYSIVLAIPGIDRMFLHHPGSNDTFSFDDISGEKTNDAVLFHFGYPPLMKKMYENNGEELIRIMKHMQAQGTATSLDMAYVDEESEAGKADWKGILTNVLPYVDFFMPSIEELCFMLDRPKYEKWKICAKGGDITLTLAVEKDIKPLADQCMELGAKVLLLKCGPRGLYYKTTQGGSLEVLGQRMGLSFKGWSSREGLESAYEPQKILSTTGAGDTTIAAFLTAMLQGYPFDRCIQLAVAEGTSCIEEYDAISGIRPLAVLEDRIKGGWKKEQGPMYEK